MAKDKKFTVRENITPRQLSSILNATIPGYVLDETLTKKNDGQNTYTIVFKKKDIEEEKKDIKKNTSKSKSKI